MRVTTTQRGAGRSSDHRWGAGRRTGVVAGFAVLVLAATACSSTSTAAVNTATSAGTSSAAAAAGSGTPTSSGAMSSAPAGSGAMSSAPASSAAMSSATASSGAMSSPVMSSTAMSGDPKTATSLAAFGGMSGLVAAANKEGALNLIALPPGWADYGELIAAFHAKYPGITLNQQNPNGSSADEITAAKTNKGTDKAPDVFDLGTAVTLASTSMFAPYKVASWGDIPDVSKESTGLWYNDYTGTMSIGYDSGTYGTVASLNDLLGSKFKGVVALNGNPTQANAAYDGVVMAALANGGSLGDISKGYDYFSKLNAAGNLYKGQPTPAVLESGDVGVLFDWTYNQTGYVTALKAKGIAWKYFVPQGAALGAYYNQAINKDAPHPAAARLWEEFLYTPEAQNFWLKGGANPVLQVAMTKAGTINKTYLAALPTTQAPVVQTADQIKAGAAYLATNWPKISS